MKLTTSVNILGSRDIEKNLSKKITLANTPDKTMINSKIASKAVGSSSDPIYFKNTTNSVFNPDIRFQNNLSYSALNGINYRNSLLIFAENSEIKKAVNILKNEIIINQNKLHKYPLWPVINLTNIPVEKQDTAKAIQNYLDDFFYPKLYQMLNFKKDGLADKVEEYIITGKLGFEIVYDNLKRPTEIIGIIPIDVATLQKFKKNDLVYYVQQPLMGTGKPRVLHENQVILVEHNKYDYGYVSYVDKLRRPFNIMRSMQTSKILWFAAKSQVRMHVKLALGDVSRDEAIQKLVETQGDYSTTIEFDDITGQINIDGEPNNSGYREFFTAETSQSGSPEIEEINTNGPDLTEVDSLQYWEKYFWKETDIPYDRIDPNSSESWGFLDVNNIRKIELNFSKMIESFREKINDILIKPIIIQLTLKEVEIGIDLTLLDSIDIEWVAFNQYDKLGELELTAKRVEIASSLAQFGEQEDSEGRTRKALPLQWIIANYFDFTPEQLKSMQTVREQEDKLLGFADNSEDETEEGSDVEDETEEGSDVEDETEEGSDVEDIVSTENNEWF